MKNKGNILTSFLILVFLVATWMVIDIIRHSRDCCAESPSKIFLTARNFYENNPMARIAAVGDINNDGYGDAIVCNGSYPCESNLTAILNPKDDLTKPLIYVNFSPSYVGSGENETDIYNVSIKDGVVSLTGFGILDCVNVTEQELCKPDDRTVTEIATYIYDGKNMVQKSIETVE